MPDPGTPERTERPDSADKRLRRHLQRRVKEEAEAALSASGLAATIAHVALATAYARRLRDERP